MLLIVGSNISNVPRSNAVGLGLPVIEIRLNMNGLDPGLDSCKISTVLDNISALSYPTSEPLREFIYPFILSVKYFIGSPLDLLLV